MCPLPVAVLLVSLLLTGCGEETGTPDPAATSPEGTRWVGLGRVVVAVPEWWSTGETECLTPVETTVYFDSGAIADCAIPTPHHRPRDAAADWLRRIRGARQQQRLERVVRAGASRLAVGRDRTGRGRRT